MKFKNDPLAVEQNNYTSKFANAYIVYELDVLPRNPTVNLKLKNCLFGATTIVKNSDKENWIYSGYGITFDRAVSWSLANDFARNVAIFDVDYSSSSHADNCENIFLVLQSCSKCFETF